MHDKTTWKAVALLGALIAVGCDETSTEHAARKDLAQRYLSCNAALQKADWATYDDCLAAGFARHADHGEDVARAEALEFWRHTKLAFPDLEVAPQVVVMDHNDVFAMLLVTGTHEGLLHCHGDWPATHKRIGLLAFEHLTFDRAGKATDGWLYYDAKTVLGQIGVLPPDAGETRAAIGARMPGAPIVAVNADDDRERTHRRAYQQLTEAVNAHRPSDAAALLADDVVDSDPGQLEDHHGRGVIETSLGALLRYVPDYHRDVPRIYAAGDYVVAPGLKSGSWDGHPVKVPYVELARLEGNQIKSIWRFYDVADMDAQILSPSHD